MFRGSPSLFQHKEARHLFQMSQWRISIRMAMRQRVKSIYFQSRVLAVPYIIQPIVAEQQLDAGQFSDNLSWENEIFLVVATQPLKSLDSNLCQRYLLISLQVLDITTQFFTSLSPRQPIASATMYLFSTPPSKQQYLGPSYLYDMHVGSVYHSGQITPQDLPVSTESGEYKDRRTRTLDMPVGSQKE